MTILIGLDLGQRSAPTGLCVIERVLRGDASRGVGDLGGTSGGGTSGGLGSTQPSPHYLVRHLEQLPAGTTYPRLVGRATEVASKTRERTGTTPSCFVDATGLGDPVIDLLRGEIKGSAQVVPVFFTFGDRRVEEGRGRSCKVTLGKAWLVSRLQVLLQTSRLHLPRTREAETLAQELLAYEVRVDEQANDRYGAFQVGKHDELVTALGLAVQPRPKQIYGGQAPCGAWG